MARLPIPRARADGPGVRPPTGAYPNPPPPGVSVISRSPASTSRPSIESSSSSAPDARIETLSSRHPGPPRSRTGLHRRCWVRTESERGRRKRSSRMTPSPPGQRPAPPEPGADLEALHPDGKAVLHHLHVGDPGVRHVHLGGVGAREPWTRAGSPSHRLVVGARVAEEDVVHGPLAAPGQLEGLEEGVHQPLARLHVAAHHRRAAGRIVLEVAGSAGPREGDQSDRLHETLVQGELLAGQETQDVEDGASNDGLGGVQVPGMNPAGAGEVHTALRSGRLGSPRWRGCRRPAPPGPCVPSPMPESTSSIRGRPGPGGGSSARGPRRGRPTGPAPGGAGPPVVRRHLRGQVHQVLLHGAGGEVGACERSDASPPIGLVPRGPGGRGDHDALPPQRRRVGGHGSGAASPDLGVVGSTRHVPEKARTRGRERIHGGDHGHVGEVGAPVPGWFVTATSPGPRGRAWFKAGRRSPWPPGAPGCGERWPPAAPAGSRSAQEKSRRSRMFTEIAVRRSCSPISLHQGPEALHEELLGPRPWAPPVQGSILRRAAPAGASTFASTRVRPRPPAVPNPIPPPVELKRSRTSAGPANRSRARGRPGPRSEPPATGPRPEPRVSDRGRGARPPARGASTRLAGTGRRHHPEHGLHLHGPSSARCP
jgi:hypothetical protein